MCGYWILCTYTVQLLQRRFFCLFCTYYVQLLCTVNRADGLFQCVHTMYNYYVQVQVLATCFILYILCTPVMYKLQQSYLKVFYWKCLSVSGSVSEIQQSQGHILIKENRLYIEWNLLEKSVKPPFCCTVYTAGVLHTFVLHNLLGPGTPFYRTKFS